MAGDVKLKIGGDASELVAAVKSAIAQIQKEAEKIKISPGAAKSAAETPFAGMRGVVQADRTRNDSLAKEKFALDMLNRVLDTRKAKLEEILRLENKTADQIKEQERATIRLSHTQGLVQRTQETFAKNRKFDKGNEPSGSSATREITGPSTESSPAIPGILKSGMSAFGIGISAGAVAKIAKDTYTFFASEAANVNVVGGSATRSNVGYLNKAMLSGDIASQTLLQNQMPEARNLAADKYNHQLSTEFFNALTADLQAIGITKPREYFETQRAQAIGDSTLEQAQSLLDKNNSLMLGKDFFSQTFNRNLNAERSFGLGSDQFKNLQIGVNNKGFLTDQAVGLLNQVQSAGGAASGSQSSNIANTGLEMQRALNLTNSGNILGKLTGLYGNSEQGVGKMDDASKRILEESITRGFNKSENTEIMRKFTETTAGLVYQGEAKTGVDIQRLVADFSRLVPDNATPKQYEAAQSAYEKYQQSTSETSGRGGTLNFAAMQNKNFSKMDPIQIGNLMALKEKQLTSTNSDVIAAAVQQGVSPEEMLNNILEAKQKGALAQVGLSEKQLAPLKKYLGNRDVGSLATNYEELNKLKMSNPKAYQAFKELQERSGINGSESDEERIATERVLYNGPARAEALRDTKRASDILKTGTGGKKEEEYIAGQAAQEKQLVLNLKAMEDQLYPTIKGISELTQKIIQLGNAAHMLNTGELGNALINNAPSQKVPTKESLSRTPQNGSKPRSGG